VRSRAAAENKQMVGSRQSERHANLPYTNVAHTTSKHHSDYLDRESKITVAPIFRERHSGNKFEITQLSR